MGTLPPTDGFSRTDQPNLEIVLGEWIAAISSFHRYYNQLADYVNIYNLQQQFGNSIKCVGQCPIDQMTVLLVKMQKELKKLLIDMDQIDQTITRQKSRKLITHTRLLNQLNQQAQVVFQLALQSAS